MKIPFLKWFQRAPAVQPEPAPVATYKPTPRAAAGALALPAWARVAPECSPKVGVCIEVDTASYVKEWFELLGVTSPDQYWLEVAYQCAKMDLQAALAGTEYDPQATGKPAEFHFSKAPDYALVNFPKGKGIEAASRGREAREHFKRVRGRLPM